MAAKKAASTAGRKEHYLAARSAAQLEYPSVVRKVEQLVAMRASLWAVR